MRCESNRPTSEDCLEPMYTESVQLKREREKKECVRVGVEGGEGTDLRKFTLIRSTLKIKMSV